MGKKEIMRLGISLLFCSLFAILFTECTQNESIKEPNYSLQSSEKKTTGVNCALSRESAKNLLKDILVKFPSEEYAQGMRSSSTPIIGESFGYATNTSRKQFRNGEEFTDSLYIFNFANGEGFAIMADDARLEPLLAISFSGNLKEKDFARNDCDSPFYAYLKALATNYAQMKAGKAEPGGFPKDGNIREVRQSIIEVYDMPYGHCRVKWGQQFPYNMYCPIVDGKCSAAGCVPVACAQFLSIYKTPRQYKGYTFDWEQMISVNPTESPKSEAVKQIAILLRELGISMKTEYSPTSSKTGLDNLLPTLNNFGLNTSQSSIDQDYTPNLAISELRGGYPILMVGGFTQERNKTAYHLWVVDGMLSCQWKTTKYNTEDGSKIAEQIGSPHYYLKCNWGWNGHCDGYYSVNSFSFGNGPSYNDSQESGTELREGYDPVFRYDLTIIKGIRPTK